MVRGLSDFRVDFTASGHMTFNANARSGAHDDSLLALCIACWWAKFSDGPSLLSFYRSQLDIAEHESQAERLGPQGHEADPAMVASFRRTMPQVRDDANELSELYLSTLKRGDAERFV